MATNSINPNYYEYQPYQPGYTTPTPTYYPTQPINIYTGSEQTLKEIKGLLEEIKALLEEMNANDN